MAYTIRVSLAGTNALEGSPDPRNYALLADSDNILIKEHSRGTYANGSLSVDHNLGYPPHFYTYAETATGGRFRIVSGHNLYGDFRSHATDTALVVINSTGSSREIRYFIFYDNID